MTHDSQKAMELFSLEFFLTNTSGVVLATSTSIDSLLQCAKTGGGGGGGGGTYRVGILCTPTTCT